MLGCIVPISFAILLVLSACSARGADLALDKWVNDHHRPVALDNVKIGKSKLPNNEKLYNGACTKLLKEMKLCR